MSRMTLFAFKVRCPIVSGMHKGGHVWTRQNAYGLTVDEAAKEIIQRLPEAIELEQVSGEYDASKVICSRRDHDDLPSERRSWCSSCGQDWDKHPILAESPEAAEAVDWIDTLRRENISAFVQGGHFND